MRCRDVPSRFRMEMEGAAVPAPPEDNLQTLAAKARGDYYLRRHFTVRDGADGRVVSSQGPPPSVHDLWGWRRITWQCVCRLTSPQRFLDAQFLSSSEYDSHLPPAPSRLLGKAAWRRFEKWSAATEGSRREELLINWFSMSAKARNSVVVNQHAGGDTTEMAVKRVLCDQSIELTSLFRYCLAYSMDMEKLSGDYEAGAAVELMWSRSLYSQLSESARPRQFLPAGFMERAPGIYKAVYPSFGIVPWDRVPHSHAWPRHFM